MAKELQFTVTFVKDGVRHREVWSYDLTIAKAACHSHQTLFHKCRGHAGITDI